MLGLGAYDSSEDEAEIKTPPAQEKEKTNEQPQNIPSTAEEAQVRYTEGQIPPQNNSSQNSSNKIPLEAPNGPVLGPASMDRSPSEELPTGGRVSPFSISQALIQDLTLPPVPNLDIPPSPPGSPDPAANAKFEHFLSLKTQGVHFNAKLASSSSLKNPSLLVKMMDHAGISEASQYDTSLPTDLWSATNLPHWAFKGEVLRDQQEFRQRLEDKKSTGQRSSIDFVSQSSGNPSLVASGPEAKKGIL